MRKVLSAIYQRVGVGVNRRLSTRVAGSVAEEGQSIAIPSNLKLSRRCLEAVRDRESTGSVGVKGAERHINGFVQLSDASMLRVPVLCMPWEGSNSGKYESPTKFVIRSGIVILGSVGTSDLVGFICSKRNVQCAEIRSS